jgi:LysR family glycine cleavage system transcriptional activator
MLSVPFMTETIVPVCHPDLMENGQLDTPKSLADQTLISYDTEPMAWSEWLPMAGQADLRVSHSLQFEQMYFALQAAAEGLGVVLVPLFLVADDIIAGRMCAPFGLLAARQRRYYAHAPLSAQENPVIEGFCEWLLKEGQDTEQSIDQLSAGMGWTPAAPS